MAINMSIFSKGTSSSPYSCLWRPWQQHCSARVGSRLNLPKFSFSETDKEQQYYLLWIKHSSLVIQPGAPPSLWRMTPAPAFLPVHPFLMEKGHLGVDWDTKAPQ